MIYCPLLLSVEVLRQSIDIYLPIGSVVWADNAYKYKLGFLYAEAKYELVKQGNTTLKIVETAPQNYRTNWHIETCLPILGRIIFKNPLIPIVIPGLTPAGQSNVLEFLSEICLETSLTWTDKGELVSKTQVRQVRLSALPDAGIYGISLSSFLQQFLSPNTLFADIGRRIDAHMATHIPFFQGWDFVWEALYPPLLLNEMPPVWADLGLQKVNLPPIISTHKARQLALYTALWAAPKAYLSAEKPLINDTQQVKKKLITILEPLSVPHPENTNSRTKINIYLDYAALGDYLSQLLKQNGLRFKGISIPVEFVQVRYVAPQQLEAKMRFGKGLGEIEAIGSLQVRQVVNSTGNNTNEIILLASYRFYKTGLLSWLTSLLKKQLNDFFANPIVLPTENWAKQAKAFVNKEWANSRPHHTIQLNTRIIDLIIEHIEIQSDYIVVSVNVSGDLSVEIVNLTAT